VLTLVPGWLQRGPELIKGAVGQSWVAGGKATARPWPRTGAGAAWKLVGRHEKQIMIRYVGACDSCPASLTGTLVAVEGMLQKEVDPEIVVISV
jgi:hypothetical protein